MGGCPGFTFLPSSQDGSSPMVLAGGKKPTQLEALGAGCVGGVQFTKLFLSSVSYPLGKKLFPLACYSYIGLFCKHY